MFEFFNERDKGEVFELKISELKFRDDGIFSLYEGERLEEMVRSIKRYGIISPVVVREVGDEFELLAGNNRVNACTIAGLEKVPVYNVGKISDETAMFIITETNIVQRGFGELTIFQRAHCIAARHEAMIKQGARTDIEMKRLQELLEQGKVDTTMDTGAEVDDDEYDMSLTNQRRYVRVATLCNELVPFINDGTVGIKAGVNISYISHEHQRVVAEVLSETEKVNFTNKRAFMIRKVDSAGLFSRDAVIEILENAPKKVKKKRRTYSLRDDVMDQFFDGKEDEEIRDIIVLALEQYFGEKLVVEEDEDEGNPDD